MTTKPVNAYAVLEKALLQAREIIFADLREGIVWQINSGVGFPQIRDRLAQVAECNRAEWSGGPHSARNIEEGIRRNAALHYASMSDAALASMKEG